MLEVKFFVLLSKVILKMSNLTKQTIRIPLDINIKLKKDILLVEGPLGNKTLKLFMEVVLDYCKNEIRVTKEVRSELTKDRSLKSKILQGSTHSLIKQIILGLSGGYRKQLILVGVGYRASIEKKILILKLGYSHNISIVIPPSLRIKCIKPTKISIFGNSSQEVNQMAANIRSYKLPEPYKGKGILYQHEKVTKKEGKRS